ncbi:MAG: hypothetical protein ACM3VT_17835 [Solirubrobacterales bacterium]
MKMCKWIWVLVLSFAGLALAVNTTTTLNDKGWERTRQGLIEDVETRQGGAVRSADPNLKVSDASESVLGSLLETDVNLPAVFPGDWGSVVSTDGGIARQPAGGLAGVENCVDVNDPNWSLNMNNGPDADFVSASSQVKLPSFAEIDWMATPLPTAKETSLMVVVVFPALGMLVAIFLGTMIVLRIRRRRPLDRSQQLLRV